MKINFRLLSFLVFCACVFSACVQEDDFITDPTTIIPEPEEIINTSITGIVIDNNDQPIENARVYLFSSDDLEFADTDAKGQFTFTAFENKGSSAFIYVWAADKFDAYRRAPVIANRVNYTEIKMQDKTIIGTIPATTGGSLTTPYGASIEIPVNGVKDGNGELYTGDIKVGMSWIDPTAPDLAARMVGDLSAIDADGRRRALATYGMLTVELYDATGVNELSLVDFSPATLEFPVPASIQANAPATIPLWSFNENEGRWIEEGTATYINGVYRGEVSHFSSWNVDFMFDPIEITGQVNMITEGDAASTGYLQVYVSSDVIGRKGGWLSDDGSFRFYNFPMGEAFQLEILDQCGNVLYSENYGPYQNDEELGTIDVSTSSSMIVVEGNALNCGSEAVTNGLVQVDLAGRSLTYELEDDGTFRFALDVCKDTEASVNVVDLDSLTQKESIVNDSQAEWLLTDLLVCDALEDYITITINGGTEVVYTAGVNAYLTVDSLNMNGPTDAVYISFQQEGPTAGGDSFSMTFEKPDLTMLPQVVPVTWLNYYTLTDPYYLDEFDVVTATISELILPYNGTPGRITGTYAGAITHEENDGLNTIQGTFSIPLN